MLRNIPKTQTSPKKIQNYLLVETSSKNPKNTAWKNRTSDTQALRRLATCSGHGRSVMGSVVSSDSEKVGVDAEGWDFWVFLLFFFACEIWVKSDPIWLLCVMFYIQKPCIFLKHPMVTPMATMVIYPLTGTAPLSLRSYGNLCQGKKRAEKLNMRCGVIHIVVLVDGI